MNEVTVARYHPHEVRLAGAAACDDPFGVEVSATFSHQSGRTIGPVPGFYDGDGEWVVRFCPARTGEWRGRTTSPQAELDGVELGPVRCVPNEDPLVHGRPLIDPRAPRRFALEDGTPFVPLGFECDWLFSLHQSCPDGFRRLADRIAERGFNTVVTNVYAHTGFSDTSSEWVFGPPRLYVFGGTNDAPDHSRLNPAFFRDLDAMMAALHARGIVVHLMIQVQNKKVAWPPRRSADDERYWRYVVARCQAWPNLIWDVGKESYYFLRELGSHDYTLERIRRIRGLDAHGHLVTVHDSEQRSAARMSPADEACDFVSDQVHLGDTAAYNREAVRRFRSQDRPYLNIEYGYEEGAEPIGTYHSRTTRPWQDVLLWTWAIYLGGGYPCYYYSNTSWDLVKFDPEPPGWRRYRFLRDLLGLLDLNAMVPDNEYVPRGFCLAEAGRQYLGLLPEGGDLTIDLSAMDASVPAACTWMDVFTGERGARSVRPDGFATHIPNPLPRPDHPCAVVLRAG